MQHSALSRTKGSWRSLIPFAATLFLISAFCVVITAIRWVSLPEQIVGATLFVGAVNLAGGVYFGRHILRKRHAEQNRDNNSLRR